MLARANRLVRAEDFREVVRHGRRFATPGAVFYRVTRDPEAPLRFGIIVSKAIGSAVERNKVKRRFRAIGRQFVDAGGRGHDVVVRALPPAAGMTWSELTADADRALDRLVGVSR